MASVTPRPMARMQIRRFIMLLPPDFGPQPTHPRDARRPTLERTDCDNLDTRPKAGIGLWSNSDVFPPGSGKWAGKVNGYLGPCLERHRACLFHRRAILRPARANRVAVIRALLERRRIVLR